MNQQAFESGKRAYQEADWLRAVTLLDGAKQPGEVAGEADHLRGNAYMKLGQFDAAAAAYESALADTSVEATFCCTAMSCSCILRACAIIWLRFMPPMLKPFAMV